MLGYDPDVVKDTCGKTSVVIRLEIASNRPVIVIYINFNKFSSEVYLIKNCMHEIANG